MRYLSVCSGIEAASVAWAPLGWQAAAFSEIEKFPRAVLRHRFPTVPLHGDFTTIRGDEYGPVQLLVGGTPCQSFSVAGLRKGLADPRGNLALAYLALAERLGARWLVWENVPGVLSSNGGRDFGAFLGGLAELGYGFAYRVLDAQYFGVPQRRRRVFVVAHLGDWRRAAAVLFERHSLSGHPAPRRETGEGVAPTLAARTRGGGGLGTDFDCDGGLIPDLAFPLTAREGKGPNSDCDSGTLIAHTLRGDGFDASEGGTGRGTPLVPFAFNWQSGGDVRHNPSASGTDALTCHQTPAIAFQERGRAGGRSLEIGGDVAYALTAPAGGGRAQERNVLTPSMAVRRITCVEAERLQGFPSVKTEVVIHVCQHGNPSTDAIAAILSHAQPAPAGSAESGVCPQCARLAALRSAPSNLSDSRHAVLSVHIDLERSAVQLRSAGRLLWSASGADEKSSSPLPMQVGAFARLAALMTTTAESATRSGRVASPPSTTPSTTPWSGSVFVALSGRAISALASDAGRLTTAAEGCLKSTTSHLEAGSPNCASIWTISSYCVVAAISGFIPDAIRSADSYEIRVETEAGWTAIPWRGKPASECPDGPRYKALGNSMAVPCMAWIGRRIAAVDAIPAATERAA